ncbi:hypothetical protein HDU96_002568 [Phlyctochytrium bullatum]|nr:hypothetical protein HDU96_002568 [Phlyctochytrium bullatum]
MMGVPQKRESPDGPEITRDEPQTKRAKSIGSACGRRTAYGGLVRRTKIAKDPFKASPLLKFQSLRPHPNGVLPMGNYFLRDGNAPDSRAIGLGSFGALEDEMIVQLLSDPMLLGVKDLCRLAACSRAFYVFACFEEIWRGRTIQTFGGRFGKTFGSSWRDTFRRRAVDTGLYRMAEGSSLPPLEPIRVPNFYSDFLYSSWRCATIPLDQLCRVNAQENIDRRSNLSVEEFIESYAKPNVPVIITDVVPKWPAYGKWNLDYLVKVCGDVEFRAEAVDVSLETYASYSKVCGKGNGSFEESPLYLFDRNFANRTGLEKDYCVPEYFRDDLFKVMGDGMRPDYRWLILGPPRSGSTFHLDPNQTSAWNAVISGSKKWLLFPPEVVPPGVYPSEDGSEVTSPVSLAEWFLNHYHEIASSPVKPIECICRAGDLIFVPRGWWHAVMNLEETVAITQNFVSRENLSHVLRFMATKPDQISGFKDGCGQPETLYKKFVECLGEEYRATVEQEINERKVENTAQVLKSRSGLAATFGDQDAPKFSFGFDLDD